MTRIDIDTATAPTFADVQMVMGAKGIQVIRHDVIEAARRIVRNEELGTVAASRVFRANDTTPTYAYLADGNWNGVGVVAAARALMLGDEVRRVVKG